MNGTRYPSTVADPNVSHRTGNYTNMLKPAYQNKKMGGATSRVWQKGGFRGLPLYTLTLEERATCHVSCPAWDICYGNNMPFATRFSAADGGEALMDGLSVELDALSTRHPTGFSVRLHVLGDFFSVAYVHFWRSELRRLPGLHIYGYSHQPGRIARALDETFEEFPTRFVVFQSDPTEPTPRPHAMLETTEGADAYVACPEETGKVASCLDCGLCTNPKVKGVRFLLH